MDLWLQSLVLILAIALGARYGGIGLGAAGGLGMTVLVLVFHLKPGSVPISVLLIIAGVITCVSLLQACGGMDYMVSIAEKMLRKNPNAITFMGPLVCYFFCTLCGTGYVAFAVYPVIAEVALAAGIRPERALSMSATSSQIGVINSPMSAATAAMVGLLASQGVTLGKILMVTVPACLIATIIGCLFVMKRGPELADDPEYQRRLAAGEIENVTGHQMEEKVFPAEAKRGVWIFLLGVLVVIILGSNKGLLPSWTVGGKTTSLSIPEMIQIVMLGFATILMMTCGAKPNKAIAGSVFRAGMTGVIAIWGVSWMTSTYFNVHKPLFIETFRELLQGAPFLFAVALALLSALLFSQGATVVALMPVGVALGIPAPLLVAMYPAVNCTQLIPAGATPVGCVAFDRTGTTRIGKYVMNHSFLWPLIITNASAVAIGYVISRFVF